VLDTTKLSEIESVELCKIVLQRNQTALIEKWIKEEKLTPTGELGNLWTRADPRIALAPYTRVDV
jgi:hypothetical protein